MGYEEVYDKTFKAKSELIDKLNIGNYYVVDSQYKNEINMAFKVVDKRYNSEWKLRIPIIKIFYVNPNYQYASTLEDGELTITLNPCYGDMERIRQVNEKEAIIEML